jgi:hypothetical protein
MLLQLMPDQISSYWPIIKYAVENALPPTAGFNVDMNYVLESLLSGEMQAWATIEKETKKIVALTTTMVTEDPAIRQKTLLIYSITAMGDKIGKENWIDNFRMAMKYAKERGCTRITAYTQSEAIKKMAEYFGGDTSWSVVTFKVA